MALTLPPGLQRQLKPPVNHVLSAEMHAYFSSVVAAVRTNDETVEPVLSTLANNAGVHQLVPYLCHYVAEEVCVAWP